MLEKCVLTSLGLNWNQRLEHNKKKLNICHHMLMSSTQLQNSSFHVVEKTRMSTNCQKNEKGTCKACKNTVFHCQICKFEGVYVAVLVVVIVVVALSSLIRPFTAASEFIAYFWFLLIVRSMMVKISRLSIGRTKN